TDGKEAYCDSATGDGPVDAAFNAIERITKMSGQLVDYTITSVTWGGDAVGEVFVKVIFNDVIFTGHAASTDIVTGSVEAYLQAANRAITEKSKKIPQGKPVDKQVDAV
ncbi:MAG: alpha-isopropylmalate synthase regulatory domain-containing protein, partial [Candidatus Kryptoniota bacterium]